MQATQTNPQAITGITQVIQNAQANAIAAILNLKPKGSIYTVEMQREAKTFKTFDGTIEKHSIFQGSLCDYANRAPVKDAVEAGYRDEPELPSWVKESFEIGNTKFWLGHNGKQYLLVPNNGNKPKVKWFLNGQEVSYKTAEPYLLASERVQKPSKEDLAKKGQAPFNCITLENILAVR